MRDLVKALQRMKVNTNSLACLGCGHEHNCSVHGCAIIREAAEKLQQLSWISMKDRLPEQDPRCAGRQIIECFVAYQSDGVWHYGLDLRVRATQSPEPRWIWGCSDHEITYWMLPVSPEAPKEE